MSDCVEGVRIVIEDYMVVALIVVWKLPQLLAWARRHYELKLGDSE